MATAIQDSVSVARSKDLPDSRALNNTTALAATEEHERTLDNHRFASLARLEKLLGQSGLFFPSDRSFTRQTLRETFGAVVQAIAGQELPDTDAALLAVGVRPE